MSTFKEQAKRIASDAALQSKTRFRLVVDIRDNGHKIEHHNGEWHVLEKDMIEEQQIRFALEQLLEKGFAKNAPQKDKGSRT